MTATSINADDASTQAHVSMMLENIVDPCSIAIGVPINLLDMGIIRNIGVKDGDVEIALRPTSPFCFQLELISSKIRELVEPIASGKVRVSIDPTDDWVPEMMAETARARLKARRSSESAQ